MHIMSVRDSLKAYLVLSGLALFGCIGDKLTAIESSIPPDDAIGGFSVSPPVSLLSVGGTQQLTPAAISMTGQPLTLDSVSYALQTLGDSVRVRVSASGVVSALATTSAPVLVNVLAFKGRMGSADRVLLQVTPTTINGLQISIQPVPPDSAKLAAGSVKTIIPQLRNPSTGESVANPAMKYSVKPADASRLAIYRPRLDLPAPFFTNLQAERSIAIAPSQIGALVGEGNAWVYGTVSAYGTILRDSVLYSFSYPYAVTLTTAKDRLAVTNVFAARTTTLAPGATVTFRNGVSATDPLLVRYDFDNPAGATSASPASTTGGASGNVTTLSGGQSARRQFLTPGTYRWTMIASGGPAPWNGQTLSGTIVIK